MSVKERKRGRPHQSQKQLSPELIILKARNLMKKNGKVPSIRQISRELEVDAMAIYHYFSNKSALLEALTLSLIDDIYVPKVSANWQDELEQLCKSYLELLKIYPGLLETLLSIKTFGLAQLFSQRLETTLAPLQLSPTAFIEAQNLIIDYIHGVALAIQYNSELLSVDCIDSSLSLICKALEA